MESWKKTLISFVVLVAVILLFKWTSPVGRAWWNAHFFAVQKTDDATSYRTKKQVEDSCRSMIASYESDKLTYEQYKDAESSEKQGWAEQAKMRANKTASTYNNFVLENSFVWVGNVPSDIKDSLEDIE